MSITPESLPLLHLFSELRRADIPLGIEDYQQLLVALQGGFGQADRPALHRLCRALWLKTRDAGHLKLFDTLFETIIPQSFGRPAPTPADTPTGSPGRLVGAEELANEAAPGEPTSQPAGASQANLVQFEATSGLADEVQLAAAVQPEPTAITYYYSFSGDYLPVSQRQMKQNWRYLRRASRFGPPEELDLEATVERIAREGSFTEPVLRPRRVNRAQLVLLLDHDGSMVPFHGLSRRLAETAQQGGRLGAADIFYFHDCPVEYLYCDPYYQEGQTIAACLGRLHPVHTSLLIFSDAGAGRGRLEAERVAQTRAFLQQARSVVRHIAWLNPMPAGRWPNTTAGRIAELVPMFEISPLGMQRAIKVLRGQRPHAQE